MSENLIALDVSGAKTAGVLFMLDGKNPQACDHVPSPMSLTLDWKKQ